MEHTLGFSFEIVIADYIQTNDNNWYMLEIKDFKLIGGRNRLKVSI